MFSNTFYLDAQMLTVAPYGNNKRTITAENVGLTDVIINYNAPWVKGRTGKIWGGIVHEGFGDFTHSYPGNNYGTNIKAPWRAGANENTTFTFSTDVKINGHELPAGKYGFFIAYGAEESILIFSKNHTSWGSYFYDESEDALRVKVKPTALDQSVELLKYEFSDRTDSSSTISLSWEKKKFFFTVSVDIIKTQINSFRQELRGDKGFLYENWRQAAAFCLVNNTNLGEALHWINMAISPDSNTVASDSGFVNLYIKAQILERLQRNTEAEEVYKAAAYNGKPAEVYPYVVRLISRKKNELALKLMKWNSESSPNQFFINAGLARGYSAVGDYKTALVYSKKALLQATPDQKAEVEKWITQLKAGNPLG